MLLVIFSLIILLGSILTYKILNPTKGKSFLGYYIFSLTLITLNQFLSFYNDYFNVFPIFNPILGYFLAPLLYFHFLSLLPVKNIKQRLWRHIWFNFPFILYLTFWIFDDYRRKILVLNTNSYVTALTFLQCAIYVILYLKKLNKHKSLLNEIKHTVQFKRILWSHYILIFFLLLITIITIENFLIKNEYSNLFVHLIFGVILLQILLISIKDYRFPTFFINSDNTSLMLSLATATISDKIDLTEIEILEKLNEVMSKKKKFQDSNLSLNSLATELKIPSYKLSKIINATYNQSFHDFINSFRLNEAKLLLRKSEYADLRINEIMYKVGFNSKSSFNTWFKKYTGTTPSNYRKLNNI